MGSNGVVIVCLLALTAVAPAAAVQCRKMWTHTTRFFDVAGTGDRARYRRARVRAVPIGCLGCGFMLIAGWIFVLDPTVQPGAPDAWQVTAIASSLLAALCALATVPIILLNRPKRLVPPHWRSQRGYLVERQEPRGA